MLTHRSCDHLISLLSKPYWISIRPPQLITDSTFDRFQPAAEGNVGDDEHFNNGRRLDLARTQASHARAAR
jgi:hypothetical protein